MKQVEAEADRVLRRKSGEGGQGDSHAQPGTSLIAVLQLTLGTLAVACATATSVPGAYLALLTSLGVTPSREDRSRPFAPSSEARRFAFLVPAHNEEQVIAAAIASLRNQRYSTDLFEIHVVADNCTDGTADVAASAGATVHERRAAGNPGKGPALNWLTARIMIDHSDVCRSIDVIVIVDADTVVHPDFLRAMNEAFARGSVACQGYYAVSEPEASPSIALRYAALASRHYLRPLGRRRLGGSVGLFGNGMAFSADLMRERAWSGHLIEDAEFQLELLMDGVTVDYVPDARVSAEMPDTFGGAATQNERWELGRVQLIERFVPDLIRAALGPRSQGGLRRRTYLDAAIDQLVPPLSILAVLDVAAIGVTSVATVVRPTAWRKLALVAALASALALVAHVLTALRLVRAPRSVYRGLASAPQFVLWKLKIFNKLRVRSHEVTWVRTQRNPEKG